MQPTSSTRIHSKLVATVRCELVLLLLLVLLAVMVDEDASISRGGGMGMDRCAAFHSLLVRSKNASTQFAIINLRCCCCCVEGKGFHLERVVDDAVRLLPFYI